MKLDKDVLCNILNTISMSAEYEVNRTIVYILFVDYIKTEKVRSREKRGVWKVAINQKYSGEHKRILKDFVKKIIICISLFRTPII